MQQLTNISYADRILRRHGETWPRAANPPGWAQHRIDMTDTLPWFRSSQAGIQQSLKDESPNGVHVLGILIGKHGGPQSYIDAEVIITSLNGEQSTATAETTRRRDAMTLTIATNRIVGVIFEAGSTAQKGRIGVKRSRQGTAPLFPCSNMPTDGPSGQNCWVADFFLPTHMWPVRVSGQPGFVRMVRLEKFNLENQSWWANAAHGVPPRDHERDYSATTTQEICGTCNTSSPRIFEEMFTCWNELCSRVWTDPNGAAISEDQQLTYNNEFLKERKARPLNGVAFPMGQHELLQDFPTWWNTAFLGPKLRNEPVTESNFQRRMNDLLKGFVCPYCQMVNRRVKWNEWHCRNSRCNAQGSTSFRIDGAPPIMPISQVSILGSRRSSSADYLQHPLYRRTTDLPDFTVLEFELGEGCYVAYMKPKPHTNRMSGSSDELYTQVQTLAANGTLPLRRPYMPTKAGVTLTSHFAANYGERYLFTARVPTTPFTDAPQAIQNALNQVNRWVAPYRPVNEPPANELYLAGYIQGQKMNWHDDGETGLGTVITTYTLGGQGDFKLSIKQNYNNGSGSRRVRSRWIGYDPVIPGCAKYDERLLLKQQLQRGDITPEQWSHQFQALMTGSNARRQTLLQLPVSHGDIVVMHGNMCQRYLEHCVDVTTPMRFALTFRYISDAHLDPDAIANQDARLAYDVQFDPGDDWDSITQPRFLSPVASRQGSVGDPLPAISPRDIPMDKAGEPPSQRRRLDSDVESGSLDLGPPAVPVDRSDAPATRARPRTTRGSRGTGAGPVRRSRRVEGNKQ